ncbi:apses-domain-containing protein [Nadsonia fulvescens var. elongata DSM 6958]|uniref:Apses-domain-containing protein n=1 Tax=Nadsonia fulvescens var. elongata DSM 6958 TaxID=857566 RepID=A0A1E3PNG3_9ASCO|nr:apses-domain-containing protein [Nadsonia fulvescens var. elongata DSM 6958]
MSESEPQVYSAKYSGVPVLEYSVKNVAVMRRRVDGWVNATHILKVASFDKPQRTRILEKEVQKGVHEKVQGGYGKYQGTWVPLERAIEFANLYNVANLLEPLFSYVQTAQSPPPAPKHTTASSKAKKAALALKEGAASAVSAKKSKKATTGITDSNSSVAYSTQQASQSQYQLHGETTINAPIKKRRGRPPAASQNRETIPPVVINNIQETRDNSQLNSDSDSESALSRTISSPSDFMSDSDIDAALNPHQHHPRGSRNAGKRKRDDYGVVRNNNSLVNNDLVDINNVQSGYGMPNGHSAGEIGGQSNDELAFRLLNYVMSSDDNSISELLSTRSRSFNINQVLDDEGHTAFHWACSMGSPRIVESLLQAGADPTVVNSSGQTALVRAILFTNNFEHKTFPRIVHLLRDLVFVMDPKNQTILHHIAATTGAKSNMTAAKYYMEVILGKVAEFHSMNAVSPFINQQNVDGETALHIVARYGSRRCVKVLLTYNALTNIPNSLGHFAYDYMNEETNRHFQDSREPSRVNFGSSPTQQDVSFYQSNFTPNASQNDMHHYILPSTPINASFSMINSNYSDKSITNGLGNGSFINRISSPRFSEAAITISQSAIPAMIDQLEALSSAFDAELKEKEADTQQIKQLLESVEKDVNDSKSALLVLRDQLGDDKQIQEKARLLEEDVAQKATNLGKLFERSQARDLAQLVRDEENRVSETATIPTSLTVSTAISTATPIVTPITTFVSNDELSDVDRQELFALAMELTKLQSERKQLVDSIVDVWANAGVGSKMSDYRRLLSLSCEVKIEDIDEYLEGIAQALTEEK